MKVVTHNDRFHADDIFGVATLQLVFGVDELEIIRTRDEDIIKNADIVLDVGGQYDPEKGRFDHHQPGGAGERSSGIQYASFGLIWKKYGEKLAGSEHAAADIDSGLVQAIDAGDNGIVIAKQIEEMPREYVINMVAGVFGPTWEEDESLLDNNFTYMLSFARELLKREIAHARARVNAIPHIERAYKESEDKRILVLNEYYPWTSPVKELPEVFFVISPNKAGTMWRVNAVQEELFVNKKSFPKEWAGLRNEELQKISSVKDALFCHRALFMAAAKSREGAKELAQKALTQ